jgi:PIN domain nuclease of toxin-antitoxin system
VGGPAPLRLLLDTHVFLWSLLDPGHLSARVADALEDPGNELWISPLVIWEVLVLAEKRRVVLTPDAHTWVRRVLQTVPFVEAPLTFDVAIQSRVIDLPHRDPVDRFLAATALVYDLTLVTADRRLVQSRAIPTLAVT